MSEAARDMMAAHGQEADQDMNAQAQAEEQVPQVILDAEQDMLDFLQTLGVSPDPAGDQDHILLEGQDAEWLTYLDWMLEKLVGLQEVQARNAEVAQRRVDMIQGWLHDENQKLSAQAIYFQEQIRLNTPHGVDGFQAAFRTKKKSLSLPHGTLGFRSTRLGLDVLDEEKGVAWCEGHGVEPRVKKSVPKKEALEKAVQLVKETGELPDPELDGMEIREPTDTFYIKPGA